jgi:hypothetical protein
MVGEARCSNRHRRHSPVPVVPRRLGAVSDGEFPFIVEPPRCPESEVRRSMPVELDEIVAPDLSR